MKQMSDKIHISFDEINSSAVDAKLQQHAAVNRAQNHYQQQAAGAQSSSAPQRGNFLYNTIVYMTLFGLLGGICAWPLCEVEHRALKSHRHEFMEFLGEVQEMENEFADGEISFAKLDDEIEELVEQYEDNPYVELLGDETVGPQERDRELRKLRDSDERKEYIRTVLFCAIAGLVISLFLSSAEPLVSRNWRGLIINGSVGVCLGLLGGVLVGLFIDALYRGLVPDDPDSEGLAFGQIAARSIGWGILGLFLAIAPGIVMRSWKKLVIGLAGGLLGGLIGGALFDPVARWLETDWLSRAIGIVAIGLIAGTATGLIETAAKTGWLRVIGGVIAGKQFILYRNPTTIGSSPQCEIYLFKDPHVAPQHASLRKLPGGYELTDLNTPSGTLVNGKQVSKVRLRHNDQIQIGATTLLFQERSGSHA